MHVNTQKRILILLRKHHKAELLLNLALTVFQTLLPGKIGQSANRSICCRAEAIQQMLNRQKASLDQESGDTIA